MSGVSNELTSGVVFRFGVRSEDEMFFADRRQPHISDFSLGSDEEKTASESIPPHASLSAWDEDLTTLEQARAFISTERRLPIWLSVEKIRGLHSLRLIRKVHPKDLPGRDGHCEIENVWPDRKMYKAIRADLRDIARCDRSEI